LAAIGDAEILLAGEFTKEMFASARELKWIQATSAGVDRFLFPEFVASEVILTNARGVYSSPGSDHVLAAVLSFARGFNRFARLQAAHKWQKFQMDELQGQTIGIIGLGNIGREIERKAKCFGMNVLAASRKTTNSSQLGPLLEQSDFVVLSLPLTRETRGLIGQENLSRMKKTAFLINIGRGQLVKQKELVAALREGKIAGAALDVFEEEPLPSDSELWDMENVIITPHIAGDSKQEMARILDIFCENLNRYRSRMPLINVVDKQVGY
jgi:phosphoglycerate dehydrogenase-like enzyme